MKGDVAMKKLLFLAAIILAMLMPLTVLPVSGAAARGEALLIWGGDALNDGDVYIKNELEKLGFTVTAVLDTDSTSEMANGKALIYICESIMSANVLDKFKNSPIPVIACEAGVYDDMLMTAVDGLFNEPVPDGAQVQILDHTITAGLSKEFDPYDEPSGKSWMLGIPAGDGKVIAVNSDDTTKAIVFVFDAGAAMLDGFKAPAKRAGFYYQGANASTASSDANKLWINLVNWMVPEPVPETTVAVTSAPEITPTEAPAPDNTADNAAVNPVTGDISLVLLIAAAAAACTSYVAGKRKKD